jgi:hypothetical protein
MPNEGFLHRLCTWYGCLRRGILVMARTAFAARASVIMSIFVSLIIWLPDQVSEVLRLLADDGPVGRTVIFFIALIFVGVSCWYWARATLYLQKPRAETKKDFEGWIVRQLPRVLGALPFLATGLALYQAAPPGESPMAERLHYLAWASVVLAVVFYVLLFLRRRFFRPQPLAERDDLPTPWDLGLASRIVLVVLTAIGGLSFVAFIFFPIKSSAPFTTGSLIHFWAGTMVPIIAILAYLGSRLRVPFLALALVAAVAFSYFDLNDNHAVRSVEGAGKPSTVDAGAAFRQWLDKRADRNASGVYPVVFVAAEGGGIRAAYFTARVLSTLQDYCPRFAQHTYALSGVSGGSLGVAVFAGLAADGATNDGSLTCAMTARGNISTKADAVLSADLLTPLVGAFLYRDLVQQFLPFPIEKFDRAHALEDAFASAWDGQPDPGDQRFARSFYDLWTDFPGKATPALLLNATRVATGQPMVISNLDLKPGQFGQLQTLSSLDPSLAPSLAAAVGLSARFPLLTPAGTILTPDAPDRRPKQRYVDGGYFDNSGLISLINLMSSLPLAGDGSGPRIKVLIVRIENGEATTSLAAAVDPKRSSALPPYAGFSFGEALSPIRAMLNTRGAHGTLSKLQSLVFRDALRKQGVDAQVITFSLVPGKVPIPLGWALTKAARLEMQQQLGQPRACTGSEEAENDCALGAIIGMLGTGS